MELSIADVARITGMTSRTLRHYDAQGLLAPTRVGPGGLRYYDDDALLRLQRILLLRELGVPLKTIGAALAEGGDPRAVLVAHARELDTERERLARLVASVHHTIEAIDKGEQPMATKMFDGFDHTEHKDEVIDRWGEDAYTRSNNWYASLADDEKAALAKETETLIGAWALTSGAGLAIDSIQVRRLARRQYEWVATGWGGIRPTKEAFADLGEMYVADPRFGKTYSVPGREFAQFVRDAMVSWAESELPSRCD